jgi:hypothetical protein
LIHVHIGPHKTGSTSIQSFMLLHEGVLAAQGVHYPDVGRNRSGGHYGLKAEVRDRESSLPGWAELGALDAASAQSQFVVSCEGFEYLNAHQIGSIAERLRGRQVKVIGYFREYGGLVQSQYLQLSRICRNVDDFDTFFDRYLDDNERLFTRFERWADAFGWANVRVRHFDRSHLVGGDVVEDFLRQIGVSRALLKIEGASERNLAPPWEAVEVMRAVFRELGELGGADDEDRLLAMRKQVRAACEMAVSATPTAKTTVDYLSAAQRARCNELTCQDLADFNRHLPEAGLPALDLATCERAFMPSVAHVDSADVVAAMARLTVGLLSSGDGDKLAQRMKKKAERAEARQAQPSAGRDASGDRERKARKVSRSISQPSAGGAR